MIGLDTNILVRYVTQDDPVQSPRANALIERRLTGENPGFISTVALAELAWVLQRAYGHSSIDIAAAIEHILQIRIFVVESEAEVFIAMTALREGVASFTDALIGALGAKAGCSVTLTFDKRAARLPGLALA